MRLRTKPTFKKNIFVIETSNFETNSFNMLVCCYVFKTRKIFTHKFYVLDQLDRKYLRLLLAGGHC